jgi:LmbE family N-acetylglucosaminyl deacetylase
MPSDWLAPTAPDALCALFVLAHPDDEFFCLPIIEAEVRGGRAVHVVYLTDGGPQAQTREAESRGVLEARGVRSDRLRFAGHEQGWPDGALFRHVPEARSWLRAHVASIGPCARVYVTAYEGGHHDHDCSYGVVAALMVDGTFGDATCLQFPLYTGRSLPGALFQCMAPIPENGPPLSIALGRREALRCWRTWTAYPSQWKTWIALSPASMPAYLARRSIVVQHVDPARIAMAPHEGAPYYTRRFHVSTQTVLDALRVDR